MSKEILGKPYRILTAAFLATAIWMLTPAQSSWACGGTNPTVLCVDTDATGGTTGLSWTDAYTNVQDALDVTNADSSKSYEIWVAEGVYVPGNARADSFLLTQAVKLYGGFDGTETIRDQRNWSTNPTILSGDIDGNDITENGVVTDTANINGSNVYHVIYVDGTSASGPITTTTVIDGFTITAGSADGDELDGFGGGFYGNGPGSDNACNPTLIQVSFIGNLGGGMYNAGYNGGESNPQLTDVTFVSNSAEFGGGMLNSGHNGTSSPTLEGVTFRDNSASTSGGGMYNFGQSGASSPSLTDVTFSGNQAKHGGGMYNAGYDSGESNPTLTNVTFSSNIASDGSGGGMFNNGTDGVSSPTLEGVTFSDNSASVSGGGMFNDGTDGVSSPTLTEVIFSDNSASFWGGGMCNSFSSPSLTDVTFSGNQAAEGGGMCNSSSSPIQTNVTFSDNQAKHGGGMYNDGSDNGESNPTLVNVTFSGNLADYEGGGMKNWASSPMLINVTFSGNQADEGGGMYNDGSDNGESNPTLVNTILSGNTASDDSGGNQIYNSPYATPTISDSLIEGSGGSVCWDADLGTDGGNNLDADPLFVDAVSGNYRLQACSAAIDAGDSSAIAVASDLDGNPRVQGEAVDMGAYEASPNPCLSLVKTVTPDTFVAYRGTHTYTVSLNNSGAANDPSVLFTDTLPSEVDFTSWITSPLETALTGDVISWSGPVGAGEVLTWTFTVEHTGGYEMVTNTAEVSGTVQTAEDDAEFALLRVLHVNADAPAGGDGLSWGTAYKYLQDALDHANAQSNHDYEIWVAEDVYYPDVDGDGDHAENSRHESFILSYNNVQLYGGFAGGEDSRDARDPVAHVTVLSGDIDQNDTDPDDDGIIELWNDIHGSNAYHVLRLDGVTNENITSDTVIDGFTITAGFAIPDNDGGGLFCDGKGSGNECSPTLTNVTFSGNLADDNGGGMYNAGDNCGKSNPTLTNVTFTGNLAVNYNGGGMHSNGFKGENNPTLIDVIFNGNQAGDDGGGMCNDDSNPTLRYVVFYGNHATWSGGGMYNVNSSPTLGNVIFSSNQADDGGGMYNFGFGGISSPTLINVIFSGNSVSDNGGGMSNRGYDDGTSNPRLINVLFRGNLADHGGGMHNSGGDGGTSSPTLNNVTFSGNQAGGSGGGMYNSCPGGTSSPTLTNCILWGNAADGPGSQMYNDSASATVNYSLIQGGCPADTTCDANLLTTDPQFVAPISASTAPTTTGDYHLQGGSPAIDAGDNTAITVTVDLDGNPRIINGVVDMGAYEYKALPEITVTPSVLAFGDQKVDAGPSVTQTATITNDGDADLNITGVSLTGADAGEFAIESDSGESALAPGSTRTIQVSFDPVTGGTKSAQLTIQSNDSDEPTVDLGLSGTGIPTDTMEVFLPIVMKQ